MVESKTLVDLVLESNEITNALISTGGEITAELEERLQSFDLAVAHKVDAYHHVMERLDAEENYWGAKALAFQKIAKSHAKIREMMKERVKSVMIALQKKELLGNDYKFTLSNTKPALVIHESELPKEFLIAVTEYKPDKERIRNLLEQDVQVPGATLRESFSLRPYLNRKKDK